MKKYKLTKNTRKIGDIILYQIQALKDFSDVKRGDLGGWIEKEENLSQDCLCWVYDNARVYGDLKLKGGYYYRYKLKDTKIKKIDIGNDCKLVCGNPH